jgi:hypothetical protein
MHESDFHASTIGTFSLFGIKKNPSTPAKVILAELAGMVKKTKNSFLRKGLLILYAHLRQKQ